MRGPTQPEPMTKEEIKRLSDISSESRKEVEAEKLRRQKNMTEFEESVSLEPERAPSEPKRAPSIKEPQTRTRARKTFRKISPTPVPIKEAATKEKPTPPPEPLVPPVIKKEVEEHVFDGSVFSKKDSAYQRFQQCIAQAGTKEAYDSLVDPIEAGSTKSLLDILHIDRPGTPNLVQFLSKVVPADLHKEIFQKAFDLSFKSPKNSCASLLFERIYPNPVKQFSTLLKGNPNEAMKLIQRTFLLGPTYQTHLPQFLEQLTLANLSKDHLDDFLTPKDANTGITQLDCFLRSAYTLQRAEKIPQFLELVQKVVIGHLNDPGGHENAAELFRLACATGNLEPVEALISYAKKNTTPAELNKILETRIVDRRKTPTLLELAANSGNEAIKLAVTSAYTRIPSPQITSPDAVSAAPAKAETVSVQKKPPLPREITDQTQINIFHAFFSEQGDEAAKQLFSRLIPSSIGYQNAAFILSLAYQYKPALARELHKMLDEAESTVSKTLEKTIGVRISSKAEIMKQVNQGAYFNWITTQFSQSAKDVKENRSEDAASFFNMACQTKDAKLLQTLAPVLIDLSKTNPDQLKAILIATDAAGQTPLYHTQTIAPDIKPESLINLILFLSKDAAIDYFSSLLDAPKADSTRIAEVLRRACELGDTTVAQALVDKLNEKNNPTLKEKVLSTGVKGRSSTSPKEETTKVPEMLTRLASRIASPPKVRTVKDVLTEHLEHAP